MVIATSRRYTIHGLPSVRQTACAKCGEAMLLTEQAADFFAISQRYIFQIIETDAVHFIEIKTGAVMICLSSLAEVLEMEKFIPE